MSGVLGQLTKLLTVVGAPLCGWSHSALLTSVVVLGVCPAIQASQTTAIRDSSEAPQKTAAQNEVSVVSIQQWIDELDSDLFIVRERATQKLIGAGRTAIPPLAGAADSDALEVATRAIHVLLQLSDHQDDETSLAAIEKLAQLKNRPAEQRTAETMLTMIHEQKLVADIARLGGVEKSSFTVNGHSVLGHLQIGESWKGGNQGLGMIGQLRWLQRLSVHGTPITDQGLTKLHGMQSLKRIELFGTEVTDEGLKSLQQANPQLQIDRRHGALLGVHGFDHSARITHVRENSAAAEAGLQRGDVVSKFDGQPVKDFGALTSFIAQRRPGEKAVLEVLRNGKVLTKEVTFQKWR